MLYLVQPDRQLKWTPHLGQDVLNLTDAEGKDLGLFDWWEPAELPADEDVVRVALRYGIPSSVGIVLDARHVMAVRRPNELRTTFREADQNKAKTASAIASVEKLIEDASPGWIAEGRRLDEQVQRSLDNALAEADAGAAEEIAGKTPRPELIAHWTSLSGRVPSPA